MRLRYVGCFLHDYTTESEIRDALRALGHHVECFEEDRDLDWMSVVGECDALLWTHAASRTWDTESQRYMLRAFAAMGIPSIGLHLDRYFGLARQNELIDEPFWHCDTVFTADGGHDQEFAAIGINHRWMPPATRTSMCRRVPPLEEFACDVAFVGSWQNYHAEWPHRRQLVEFLEQTYGDRFGLWPRGEQVRGERFNALCSSARVVVADSCLTAAGKGPYWSDRLPRVAGAGGVVVHPQAVGLDDHFPTVPTWKLGDWDDLTRVIDKLLAAEESAIEQARTDNVNLARLLHTWEGRMRYVLHTALGSEWPGLIRPATTDEVVVKEVWEEDVYRARGRIVEGSTVVDVGANVGFFSIYAASLGGKVVAVEPSARNRTQLERNFARAPGADIRVLPVAVGGEAGTCAMTDEFFGGGGARAVDGSDIEVVPLDVMLAGVDSVDFMKMDIEGAEWDAIRAASTETMTKVGYLALEFHPHDPLHDFGLTGLVRKLNQTHRRIEVLGSPAGGGYLWAARDG